MNTNKEQTKTDDEIWDDLLSSEDGQNALAELLKEAENDIKNGNLTEE